MVHVDSKGYYEKYHCFKLTDLGMNSVQKCQSKKVFHEECCKDYLYQSLTNNVHMIERRRLTLKLSQNFENSLILEERRQRVCKRKIENASKIEPKKKRITTEKEICKVCGKPFANLLTHLTMTKCKEGYGKSSYEALIAERKGRNAENKKELNKKHYEKNKQNILKKQKQCYEDNPELYKDRVRISRAKNENLEKIRNNIRNKSRKEVQKEQMRSLRHFRRISTTMNDRIKNFLNDIKTGLSFVCNSCVRVFFKRSVKCLSPKQVLHLKTKLSHEIASKAFHEVDFHASNPEVVLCHSCFQTIQKNKLPKINVSNGLFLDEVPKELQLTDLEQQLIAKVLLFMKVVTLPKSRLPAITNRVINVPLHDSDIQKTISMLPRTPDEAQIVDVKLKRKLDMKNSHSHAYIRQSKPLEAVKKLQALGNPFYAKVKLNENYLDNEEKPAEGNNKYDFEDSDEEVYDEKVGFGINAETLRNADTCLVPMNLESEVVTNENQSSSESLEVAPGQGKVPTNFASQENFDVLAYARHHPTGKFGVHYERKEKLSVQKYFVQRIMNMDPRFSQDISYIFMAQHLTERKALEGQISIAGRKGIIQKDGPTKKIHLNDVWNVFAKIRGTGKYFEKVRFIMISYLLSIIKLYCLFYYLLGKK